MYPLFTFVHQALAQAPTIECGADGVLIGCDRSSGALTPPGSAEFGNIIATAINTIITIFAILTVIFIIKGGITLIFSLGNSEKLKSARDTVLYAVLGLILAILSYAIVSIVSGIRLF